MIISDEEAAELKTWVVKKLEDISDADSDVLADYVLALIRAETPEPELRLSAVANLEDFLQDKAEKFVDETFDALHSKSYMPGYVPPQHTITSATISPIALSGPKYPQDLQPRRQLSAATLEPEQSRKRSYNEHYNPAAGADSHYARSDRQTKQLRRGGVRGGRQDFSNGRSPYGQSGSPLGLPPPGQFPFPNTVSPYPNTAPPPPDLNEPLMAMMLQAIGMQAPQQKPAHPTDPSNGYPLAGQSTPTYNGAGRNRINARCRDYDTKGFCVKGNTCPFEHGNDHVVAPGQNVAEYDPKNSAIIDVPAISPRANGFGSQDMHAANNAPGQNTYRGRGDGRDCGGRGNFSSRRAHRAEFSHAGPNSDRSNTAIVVEQIPEEKFSEGSVRDFFSAFGTITEVDMRPYKHLAIVKYSDYWGAKQAYESPKVIFDNRFVKVYWYKPEGMPQSADGRNGSTSGNPESAPKSEEAEFDKEEFEKKAMAAQQKLEEKKTLMKEAEEKRKALERQKEELAQKQAEEKKKLLEKIAAKGATSSISPDGAAGGEHKSGTAEVEDKASAQTKSLRAQVAALEAEAKSLGLEAALTEDPWAAQGRGRGRGRGRGSYRGWEGFAGRGAGFDTYRGSPRGRGGFHAGGAFNLDNRPKKVGVSGMELNGEKEEALRQHLFAVGEYEAIEQDGDKPDTQIVTFKDRKTAERFMYGTKNIPAVGKVELAWITTPSATQSAVKPDADDDTIMSHPDTNGNQPATTAEAPEVDYDVAEEDDRWLAT
ncbi:MAG: hypothetical protein L6R36_005757 [Xanthoria steineri]|nr:MAG: hypothetical protein L6R36_005757 [Xanthoria steineri]